MVTNILYVVKSCEIKIISTYSCNIKSSSIYTVDIHEWQLNYIREREIFIRYSIIQNKNLKSEENETQTFNLILDSLFFIIIIDLLI